MEQMYKKQRLSEVGAYTVVNRKANDESENDYNTQSEHIDGISDGNFESIEPDDVDNVSQHNTGTLEPNDISYPNTEAFEEDAAEDDIDLDNTQFSAVKKVICDAYSSNKVLDEDSRDSLIDNVLDCFLNKGILLPCTEIESLAKEICSIFTKEEIVVYYFPANDTLSAGGKLYYRYHNRLKKLRKEGKIPKSKRAANKLRKLIESDEIFVIDENVAQSIRALMHGNYKNFEEAVRIWKDTFEYRQNILKDPDIEIKNLFNEWKVLNLSLSHIMICEDFKQMHGTVCGSALRLKWNDTFNHNSLKFLLAKVHDIQTVNLVQKLQHFNALKERQGVAAIYYINAILVPSIGKHWQKPTIKDAQGSIIREIQCEEEITAITANIFDSGEHYPIIFFLKSDNQVDQFIIVFRKIRYHFNHLHQALDVTFKMFQIFHINFPKASQQFYVFLNDLFYDINLKIKKSAKALILSSEIKSRFLNNRPANQDV